jgi:hypothetical protein
MPGYVHSLTFRKPLARIENTTSECVGSRMKP